MNVAKPTPAAPRVFPAWLVRLRGLLTIPVAVMLVLGAPGLSYAAFTARTTASMSIGTYEIPAPATATGSRTCQTGPLRVSITISSFAPVSRATSYIATVTAPDGTVSSKTVSASGFSFTKSSSKAGTYTLLIKARVGGWTGAAIQKTYTCN